MAWPADLTTLLKRISTPAEEVFQGLRVLGDYINTIGDTREAALKAYLDTAIAQRRPNTTWYAWSGATGTGAGTSWANACTTIAAAVALMSNRDRLLIRGWFAENVDLTDYSNDPWYITIEGVHDALDMNQWGASGAGPCVDISIPSVTLKNIRFVPGATATAVRLNMNASLQGAGRTHIINNRFDKDGGKYGIVTVGAPPHVVIEDNLFEGFTASGGHAIYNTSSPTAAPRAWIIKNNHFYHNVNHIQMAANDCQFLRNTFQGNGHAITTANKLYISAGNDNVIFGNLLGGTDYSNAGGYKAGSGDSWVGNTAGEVNIGSYTTAEGHTIAAPPVS